MGVSSLEQRAEPGVVAVSSLPGELHTDLLLSYHMAFPETQEMKVWVRCPRRHFCLERRSCHQSHPDLRDMHRWPSEIWHGEDR